MHLSYQCSVGMQPADWATLPSHLLMHAFELQSNALVNCAAACVCTSWRSAVNSSFVSNLHLHIDERDCLPYCSAQWRPLLAARSNIGELKLTAGGSAVLSGIDNHLNPLTCIPAGCKGLALGGHFAPFLGDRTVQSAPLPHPGRRGDIWTSGSALLEKSESLSHITQLQSLKLEAPVAVSGLAGLGNLPKSLTSLYIGRWGEGDLTLVLPELGWSHKAKCLRRLKNLEFHECNVHICEGSIANLKALTSLSFCECGVGSGLDAVTQLTGLVCLDLAGVKSRTGTEEQQPWRRFEAWPALSVFKFASCWLIDNSTVLDIASVQEVHTLSDRLAVGIEIDWRWPRLIAQ